MSRNILRVIACAGAGLWLTLAAAAAGDALGQSARSAAEIMDILMWNREPVGGPFALTDQAGHARTDKEFRGKLMLVYFGFTYCPDVCPTDLQAIAQMLDKLGPDGEQVQPIFITVDPERDTAAHLAEYVPLFHPRLIGLTGSADAIRQVADAYKVYFAKVPLKDGDYTVDHTAYIYLMDRDGNYLGFFPPGTSADRMVEIIRQRLAEPVR
ncbi:MULTISPECIES: SCO family protein [unclassified Bradyrhizobium]|uniref:SCO family protein n=1 Tax=unclassified Bradyrhizobium TaxID=2631580 RepID=UPI0003F6BF6A|nr:MULTISPECIES: SCO family protein [unclassified Bradyrhizobium]QIG97417.1 SCO family protein [Bradyrhizobium sp. 6(2017)]